MKLPHVHITVTRILVIVITGKATDGISGSHSGEYDYVLNDVAPCIVVEIEQHFGVSLLLSSGRSS
jgi:hypothetical protein